MKPIFFKSAGEFREWLEKHHQNAREVLAGFYRRSAGRPSMTWSESVDQALCFGWIDGIRKRIDEERYSIRFTPRRPGSNWSAVNLRKIEELKKQGLMHPAGLRVWEERRTDRTAVYSYENRPESLPPAMERIFRAEKKGWEFFQKQPPSYRKTMLYWVLSAKRDETRRRRLEKLIRASAAGRRLA